MRTIQDILRDIAKIRQREAELYNELIKATASNQSDDSNQSKDTKSDVLNQSEDDSSISDVVIHALDFFQKKNINYSHVMLVQPTSPTVTSKDIDNAIELIKKTNGTNVISVYENDDIHPSIMYREDSRNRLFPILPESSEYQRQKFEKIYVRSGLFYLLESKNLMATKSLYGDKIFAIKIEKERAIAIDTEEDFVIAEKFMEEKNGL